jgi:hypothetical protein
MTLNEVQAVADAVYRHIISEVASFGQRDFVATEKFIALYVLIRNQLKADYGNEGSAMVVTDRVRILNSFNEGRRKIVALKTDYSNLSLL